MTDPLIVTNIHLDGEYIVGMDCPVCNKWSKFVGSATEGEFLELDCGHNFWIKKLVLELHLTPQEEEKPK